MKNKATIAFVLVILAAFALIVARIGERVVRTEAPVLSAPP